MNCFEERFVDLLIEFVFCFVILYIEEEKEEDGRSIQTTERK